MFLYVANFHGLNNFYCKTLIAKSAGGRCLWSPRTFGLKFQVLPSPFLQDIKGSRVISVPIYVKICGPRFGSLPVWHWQTLPASPFFARVKERFHFLTFLSSSQKLPRPLAQQSFCNLYFLNPISAVKCLGSPGEAERGNNFSVLSMYIQKRRISSLRPFTVVL